MLGVSGHALSETCFADCNELTSVQIMRQIPLALHLLMAGLGMFALAALPY